ncbi:2-oxo-4-hydroxy-4-carboxy-5-ureidoimidazoline decarboxylase [Amnibacterium flavum]|uniref:2-oxo-4-hydroxy-4-carboxy-5-ureidoimidazoline decarboxylase n=1 Tax=Amnibacterium flavum TaxID=2173173 RepID=A0A2V1HTK0_9MICO|nr:2-oxo-4-hydroxy-4-carboxy-5-ureidoimidazoline decarboxylase [Amnibacterium flavum]PVZ95651.1 2-oxo-4-hydroxy-4-carboxy-5-ureidoimidazoline decarboxylase [Amnibacterium flavum]
MPDLSDAELRDRLTAALGIVRWVDAVAAHAPYASVEQLQRIGRDEATPLSAAELDEAVSHHPRIGEKAQQTGTSATLSAGEQGGLGDADARIDADIAAGNAAYEERFGRVFLIRAAGRSRAEVLAELTRRLESSPQAESDEAAEQLRQIMELRLATLFADGKGIS